MKGRKPYPFEIVQSTNAEKNKISKDQLQKRKENQPSGIKTNLRCPAHLSTEAVPLDTLSWRASTSPRSSLDKSGGWLRWALMLTARWMPILHPSR